MIRLLTGPLLVFCLAGCANFGPAPAQTHSETPPLASPLGPARQIIQDIKVEWPGHSEKLLAVLELDHDRIAMAGMNPGGIIVFNIEYDGVNLRMIGNPLLPQSLSPKYFIQDLQLIYWPVSLLKKTLPYGWRIDSDDTHRTLYRGDVKHAKVTFLSHEMPWPRRVELYNHRHRYRLRINTLDYDLLPE